MNYKCLILLLFVLFLSMCIVSANEMVDVNVTSVSDDSPIEIVEYNNEINLEEEMVLQTNYINDYLSEINYSEDYLQNVLQEANSNDDVIVVSNWDELQYYCSQTDRDYTLKLKENTNFYPSDDGDSNQQIKIKNNVKIIGSKGSWIGDSSPDSSHLRFLAMQVEDGAKVGITLNNVTFKWITAGGGAELPEGMFLRIGGKRDTIIKNCRFYDIVTQYGHSCIIHLKKGFATFDNCSFFNCTNAYGVLSVYAPSGDPPNMIVKNCYFENNYATTEPGCINNCGKLIVYNTTFVKNKSFWWAGAIHTHSKANTTIYNSKFIDNVAGWNGGALYTYSYLQVYDSVFIGNNCTTDNGGGAIGACQYGSDPHIYIENCLFKDNANNCWAADSLSDGTGRGGAISIMDWGSLEVRDTTFIANVAAQGTAICAINAGSYGSPDVWIINNSFINHTRVGDVLKITTKDKIIEVHDNYYIGNSIEFSNLTLSKLSEGREQATFQITSTLSHPTYYDEDILDKTLYDVYINDKYVKTVNSTVFSIDFGDLDICDVYVIPTISNRKSNEVTATSTREYVFVSKSNGDDNNNGVSRSVPVSSIKRALDLAGNCQNIILLDGDYSEENILINYSVTIKGEGNATLTGATSFVSNSNLTLKNLKIDHLSTDTFIRQNTDNLLISHCILTNNYALLVQNNAFTTIADSILLNNSDIIQGNSADLDYNWWGNVPSDLSNYITLNLTSDLDSLENNQKANVKAVFYLNDGSKYTKLPDINLDIIVLNGVASQNVVNIDSGFVYTLTAFDDGVLTLTYNNVNVTNSFEFLKSNPGISLDANDIMLGDDVVVTVTTPSDAQGNLTINIGNLSQTQAIQSVKSTFTFEKLKADTYTIALTYTGDKKYLSKELTSTVNVAKYESFTQLNLSTVNVGEDVIITISTIATSTGNVTISINDNIQTLTLTDSKANFTIKNIKRGDYLIRAVYNGDDKYLSSSDSKFIEVDNLNATMSVKTEDIIYGDVAVIKVILDDDATGNITVTVDGKSNQSKVNNGKAEITFTNLDAGFNKSISVFYSGDDTYFNLTNSSTFNIAKADLVFNISSSDIKIGQFAEIVITVPQRTIGTFTIGKDVINIPMSGEISYVIADLKIGNYTYTATYDGNNYNTVSKTTSFAVREYPIPQVQNEGFNTENTHKSQYETATNGSVVFTIQFNESLSGDLVIDSFGNVYVPTQSGIYAFNQTSRLWYFTSTAMAGNLSGVAISRDVIIAPKSGDTLYFINQTSGERWGESNIYQASSFFAPVVDDEATLYIVGEYQYISEDYKLTIVPYNLWEKGGDPTLIGIGNTKPLCSPTLNENIIVVVSDNRLRIIDAKTFQTPVIKSGSFMPIRPIIGDGNIVYAVLGDSVVAYNANGLQVWKTKVIGGVGSTIALDSEQGLYHVNSRGIIYRYNLVDGTQSKFSDLKVTSGILIDANSNVYFGSNNIFHALDCDGNVLWKSDLGSKITGTPVLNKDGVIYVTSEDNKLFALGSVVLKDPNLEVTVNNITEGENLTLSISINSQATGNVSFILDNVSYSFKVSEGSFVKLISGLKAGEYGVNVSYPGDSLFSKVSKVVSFRVLSKATSLLDPELEVSIPDISQGENAVITIKINNETTGNVSFTLNGRDYSFETGDGTIVCQVPNLKAGTYAVNVTYPGDLRFNESSCVVSFAVKGVVSPSVAASGSVVNINLASDATGTVTVKVNGQTYTKQLVNGKASVTLPDGSYDAIITYSGDPKYASFTITKHVTVKKPVVKKPSKITAKKKTFKRKTKVKKYAITLKSGNTAIKKVKVTIKIGKKTYSVKTNANGKATFKIKNLTRKGKYTAKITFKGTGLYKAATKKVKITVK